MPKQKSNTDTENVLNIRPLEGIGKGNAGEACWGMMLRDGVSNAKARFG
jgi:hypothetical protein